MPANGNEGAEARSLPFRDAHVDDWANQSRETLPLRLRPSKSRGESVAAKASSPSAAHRLPARHGGPALESLPRRRHSLQIEASR